MFDGNTEREQVWCYTTKKLGNSRKCRTPQLVSLVKYHEQWTLLDYKKPRRQESISMCGSCFEEIT